MARPTKLTAKTADSICQRLRAGVEKIYAAESVGVDRRTMFLWLRYGRAADGCESSSCSEDHHGPSGGEVTYLQFLHTVTQAEADAVVLNVGYVLKAAQRDPANARWWLERRHPQEFGPRQRVEVTGAEGAPVQVETARHRLRAKIEETALRLGEQMRDPDARHHDLPLPIIR